MLDNTQAWWPSSCAAGEWAQLDLGSEMMVPGIVMQGHSMYRVTKYAVNASHDGSSWYEVDGGAEFDGPTESNDADDKVIGMFNAPVEAQYVRVIVVSWTSDPNFRMRFGVVVTTMDIPACAPSGIALDGSDDFIDIEDWKWGGTTSIETFFRFNSIGEDSPIFDFNSGPSEDKVTISSKVPTSILDLSCAGNGADHRGNACGGRAGENTYTVDHGDAAGTTITTTAPQVVYSNSEYYHIGYLVDGSLDYSSASDEHETYFLASQNDPCELTITFPSEVQISRIRLFPGSRNAGMHWMPNFDLVVDGSPVVSNYDTSSMAIGDSVYFDIDAANMR
ncbi:hypothetical protein TrLO_g15739 [Triparma laevis f. longispina]|uniref:F5/8 type C domain-containing protein n=1 Tax=Triparma laevis f. longispina TaxID=1714387 RepID=A0A9W7F5I7_9STRA|nr:hypothetical protein TrLO_g15739 [Triparma laevis f. longispina]